MSEKELAVKMGRPCCGSRTMCLINEGEERKTKFADHREFQGWHCSVNWFFMHIEQQTDSVFHHQTCQAKFGGTRGPIGKLSQGREILDNLREMLRTQTMPMVICPKKVCGCGLCAPKSIDKIKYKEVMARHVDMSVFKNSTDEAPKKVNVIMIKHEQ